MSNRFSWRLQAMAARPAVAVILLGGIFAAGCATSTFITSEPRGAKVYINDRFIGETPVTWQDRSGFPSESVWIKIDKPGFKTQTVQMKKNLRADESLLLLLPASSHISSAHGLKTSKTSLWNLGSDPLTSCQAVPAA